MLAIKMILLSKNLISDFYKIICIFAAKFFLQSGKYFLSTRFSSKHMYSELQLILTPEQAGVESLLREHVAIKLKINEERISLIRTVRKSIDARGRFPRVNLTVDVYWDEKPPAYQYSHPFEYKNVANSVPVIIIGAGPAGLFAALKLLELGMKPVIIERGRETEKRKTDIVALNRNRGIDPESNYCFGEGGAGTFSDGKLYTRSKKKGNVLEVIETFHYFGAADDILYDTHPHIGSDLLPGIIGNISKTIISHGGEIHFEEKVTEFIIENDVIRGCKTSGGHVFNARFVILATGHSAHDIYEMLDEQGIELEKKGFAMGVRVEHPQELIDRIQYHQQYRGNYLPAAAYSLVEQVDDRGVYSFCMCPGGRIVPAGTSENTIVVNGMSASKRNSAFANSGIVVEIKPGDIPIDFAKYGNLAGLKFQQYLEHLAFINNGGKGHTAPAQRLGDFVNGVLSPDLPECSYMPGIISSPLHFWLPEHISTRLRTAFRKFDKKMHGYLTNKAVILGVETRSSSAVRIPRNPDTGEHIRIKGLFPAGEGSGFSGGITSSAVDGQNAAYHVFALCH